MEKIAKYGVISNVFIMFYSFYSCVSHIKQVIFLSIIRMKKTQKNLPKNTKYTFSSRWTTNSLVLGVKPLQLSVKLVGRLVLLQVHTHLHTHTVLVFLLLEHSRDFLIIHTHPFCVPNESLTEQSEHFYNCTVIFSYKQHELYRSQLVSTTTIT